MKNTLLILAAAALMLAGCKPDQPAASLEIDKTALAFDKEGNAVGGERVVKVNSTIDWLVQSDAEWCTVNPLSVRGNAEITVGVTTNSGFTPRTATLTLKGVGANSALVKTVTVTQGENNYVLGINPVELNFEFDAAPGASGNQFTITANADWTITPKYKSGDAGGWCTPSALSGSGNATITVEVTANENPDTPRQVELAVEVGDQNSSVVVKQANNPELAESKITSFVVDNYELTGTIDEQTKKITMVYTADYADMVATVTTSTWARISPNPATPRSYNSPVEFTVTSYDGTSTSTYTVSRVLPPKRPSGIRPGSAQLMWAKKLGTDLGITTNDMTTGIAVTDQYVVLNTRNAASTYLDRATGNKAGTIDLGAGVTGSLVNFYNTADDSGNILVNNLVTGAGDFKVWKLNGVTGTPQPLINYTTAVPLGRKLSINGSVDGDAVITVGVNSTGSTVARWKITGGTLESATPEFVTIDGLSWTNNNVDIVSSSATNVEADYFAISYSNNRPTWVDGTTNGIKAQLPAMDANYIGNAIDYTVFNNTPYIVFNHANSFNWGTADEVVVANAGNAANFTATYTAAPAVGGAVEWVSPAGVYGGFSTSGTVNGNGTGDVAFKVSEDGYYLYVYLMFTNGQVACYRFDCIVDL